MARRDANLTDLDRLAREASRTANLSRRGFMLGAAGVGAAVGAGELLTGCSSDNSGSGATPRGFCGCDCPCGRNTRSTATSPLAY